MIGPELISSVLSLLGIGQSYASGLRLAKNDELIINMLRSQTKTKEDILKQVIKLNENIYYQPNLQLVKDIGKSNQQILTSLRELKQIFEPIQKSTGGSIFSSAAISTPNKMRKAFNKNPWECLFDIRPLSVYKPISNTDLIPIIFTFDGIIYVGYQMKGTIPQLFNCEYNSGYDLAINTKQIKDLKEHIPKAREIPPVEHIRRADIDFEGGEFVDKRDMRTYKWVKIASQIWMAENLAFIPKDNTRYLKDGIWVYNYKNSSDFKVNEFENYIKFGCLYDWESANRVVPKGWHLPSDSEWQELEKYIGVSPKDLNNDWNREAPRVELLREGGQTGFNVLFAGFRSSKFEKFGKSTIFWCSDTAKSYLPPLDDSGVDYLPWTRQFFKSWKMINRQLSSPDNGYYVRCIKDNDRI